MKKTYELNGKTYKTLTAMAKELGKSRLYTKDFDKYGIKVIETAEITETALIEVETIKEDTRDVFDLVPMDFEESDEDDELVDESVITYPVKATKKAKKVKKPDSELVSDLESEVVDLDVDTFGERLKEISTDGLVKMANNAEVNIWENLTNGGIRRMRLIMELKAVYFPNTVKKSVTANNPDKNWKKISTENLVSAVIEKGLIFKDCENIGIKRMRLIMALKAVGVTAESLIK